jgi:hypothetical protein
MEDQQPKGKPYSKPELTQVVLRPEEAVLGFCKSSTAAGPGRSACTLMPACSTAGS